MRHPASRYRSSMTFGPGPLSPALRLLVAANVGMFLLREVARWSLGLNLDWTLGLMPSAVLERFAVWELVTYMFMHGGVFHILFNMLALWMFGTELERIWGTRYFLKFYFVTGIGAGILTVFFALLPAPLAGGLEHAVVVGASGAIYGLLLAYGLHFPNRPIYLYLVFPIPAKYFVLIMGALAFYSSVGDNSGIANATHLGGLLVAFAFLRVGRLHPVSEAKYWYLRWKMKRMRKKFDVHPGGRANERWDRRVH